MTYEIPPTTFEQMTAPYSEQIQKIAIALREIICETLPQLKENVSGGKKIANALYSYKSVNQVLCGIQCGDSACKFFIHQFEQAQDSGFKLEGSGKHARHIKFSAPDIPKAQLVSLLNKLWNASGGK